MLNLILKRLGSNSNLPKTVVTRLFASESNNLALTFSSPYQVFYNKKLIKQIDVPSYSGDFGILANHVPCLAIIKPGVVKILDEDGNTSKYFVSSGTITVNQDSSVQILAEEAVPVDWIDSQNAKNILSEAQSKLSSAKSDEEKTEAQIAIEVGEALVKLN